MTSELSLEVEVAVEAEALLGEGPIWDPSTSTLLWVDILGDKVHRSDLVTGATATIEVDRTVGAVAPRRDGGLVAAVPGGFAALGADGTLQLLAAVDQDRPENRMNDGKCAPDGSFWGGTMDRGAAPGAGSLYRLGTDLEVSTLLTALTVSNGLGWSPDGGTVYFVDTADQRVDRLRPLGGGGGYERTPFVAIDRSLGVPDGLTVDAEGNVWVAMCFGGVVLCYAPSGDELARLPVPAALTTSVAFGGADLDLLFVTTGRADRTEEQLKGEPHAGSVFVTRPGPAGQRPVPFAG
jgi:uncharacterized repeat protein (TIGR03803 family)